LSISQANTGGTSGNIDSPILLAKFLDNFTAGLYDLDVFRPVFIGPTSAGMRILARERLDPRRRKWQPVSLLVTDWVSSSDPVTIAAGQQIKANQGTAAALAGFWPVELTDGTNVPSISTGGQLTAAPGVNVHVDSVDVIGISSSAANPVIIGIQQIGNGAAQAQSNLASVNQADTFTTTGNGTAVDTLDAPSNYYALVVKIVTGAPTWTVVLEGSMDLTNFTTILTHTNVTPGNKVIQWSADAIPRPCRYLRNRCSAYSGASSSIQANFIGVW
jgi:hypothetical protein